MVENIENRIILEAEYMLKNKSTVRKMSEFFNVSKSTIHNDLTKRLKKINFALFVKIDEVLKYNLSQRHLRGGEATKRKYLNLKKRPFKMKNE